MDLDRICVELRRRTPWEALDLGLPVLRHACGPVYRAWFATFVPCALLLFALLWRRPMLAVALVWWLKPLFDRVLLKVYAEALFGAPPTVGAVWRALPRLVLHSGLLGGLTLGRLSMARSFHLSIPQLEGQSGRAGVERRRILNRNTVGCAVWLTFVCANFSAFLQLSLILALTFFWPVEAPPLFDWDPLIHGQAEGPGFAVVANLSWLFGESLVEPFYVASGFTLYLNRRNDLEGWDIELGFRRLARRMGSQSRGVHWAALVLLSLLAIQPSTDGHAAPAVPESAAKEAVREVLADPVFGRWVPDWEWRYRGDDRTPDPQADRKWKGLEGLVRGLALALKVLSYVAAAALAVALVVLAYRYRGTWRSPGPRLPNVPGTLFGLDVRPESLPSDLAAAARRHLAAGDAAAALALLYRGALVSLLHRAGVVFQPGDTEGDCLARVRGRIDRDTERYFAELLGAWTLAAYAHHTPAAEQLYALCDRWPRHFRTEGSA